MFKIEQHLDTCQKFDQKSVINSKSNSTLSKYNKNECAVVKKFKTPTQQSVHSTPDIERLDVGHFTLIETAIQ